MKTVVFKIFILVGVLINSLAAMPDFTKYNDVKLKKRAFFDYLVPYIEEINQDIYQDRERIKKVIHKLDSSNTISKSDHKTILKLCDKYFSDYKDVTKESLGFLLSKVDIVPTSLILAQAANESAWGSSRFATDGNNLFGQWCYKKGCGIVPKQRSDNMRHEVRRFVTAKQSIKSYIMNLNTHNAYAKLREAREKLRANNKSLTGQTLAYMLSKYSERGAAYTKEIISMIKSNDLEKYNHNFT